MDIEKLKYNEIGLIPVIVQDYYSQKVITLAYMNKESLKISIDEGYTCFYSRNRKELWRKGQTSGNTQKIVSIISDCDNDSLLIKVNQKGFGCHTGEKSCFKNLLQLNSPYKNFSIENLYDLIITRKNNNITDSYTTYLFKEGENKILKKIGEECTEVIIASKNNDVSELIHEISDLYYHILVLMAEEGIELSDVQEELEKRY